MVVASSGLPEFVDSLLLWLGYIAAGVAVGAAALGVLVWRPAYAPLREQAPEADGEVTRILNRWLLWSAVVLSIATVAATLVQAVLATGNTGLDLIGEPLLRFAMTQSAAQFEIRLGLALLLSILATDLSPLDNKRTLSWWGTLLLGLGVLITFTIQTYDTAALSLVTTLLGVIYLSAASIVLGGLPPLMMVLKGLTARKDDTGHVVLNAVMARFGIVALFCVNCLTLNWLVGKIYQTAYSRTMFRIVGEAVFGLGAVNVLVTVAWLRRKSRSLPESFQRLSPVEPGFTVILLAGAAVLTANAPNVGMLQAQIRPGFMNYADTDQVRFALHVAPAQVGANEFSVDITDRRPGIAGAPAQIVLRYEPVGLGLGVAETSLTSSDGSFFTTTDTYLTFQGDWQANIILKRPGFRDVVLGFIVPVRDNPAIGQICDLHDAQIPNPVEPDSASIAAGKALYAQNCVACHGASGKGDGPVGLTLNPRPADLTYHTLPGLHTDGQLYLWITNGFPGSTMPDFERYLSDTERWNLVNYIRTLARAPHASP